MIFSLIALFALQAGAPADTIVDPVPAYASILADVKSRVPSAQIALDERVWQTWTPSPQPPLGSHPREVLERLRAGRWIAGLWCRTQEKDAQCVRGIDNYLLVSLGPVKSLPDTARVQIWAEGASLEQVAAQPANAAVPVDISVNIRLEGSRCEGCWYGNIVLYRYFLRAQSDGTYKVITRWQTGAT